MSARLTDFVILCFGGLLMFGGWGLVLGACVGWVLNLVAIAQVNDFSGMLVLRVIGIFVAPIGAVLGWIS